MPTTSDAFDFDGPALAATPDRYQLELPGPVRSELMRLLVAIGRGDDVTAAVHAVMAEAHARVAAALADGPGLFLLRGVPTRGHDRDVLATLFTAMGRALGRPAPQNLDGELLTDIRDTGADPADPDVRLYRTRAEQDFHTDGADVIGLLALQAARQGGISRVVSSVRVYHELARQRPDLAELLHAPWFFHLPGGRARGLPEALPRPIVRRVGAKLETFYIGWYLRNAQGLAGVPPLSAAQHEALALYEALANDLRLFVDMDLVPGDVQWLRNCFVLHKRTGYEDWPEPERRRHLLRLWLQVDRLADGTPRFPTEGGTPR